MLIEEIIKDREIELQRAQKNEHSEEEEEWEDDLEDFIQQWEHDFDRLNPYPEENSDFDSDNELNPLDSLSQVPMKTHKIQSENRYKKRPI